jgi:protocatechuate 3,4-dioxygenase alpha subunit
VADLTPSQTIGPYFTVLVPREPRPALVAPGATGRRVVVEGTVRDGAGASVPDALVETWQADSLGHYQDGSVGFARVSVGDHGEFEIDTVIPGAVPGPDDAPQAPHLVIGVFARGLLQRLVTRLYFPDHGDLDRDPILRLVPPSRRATLVAVPSGPDRYRFDIVLQGPGETVFFDV